MKCPACQNLETRVLDSRLSKEGDNIRRRRECLKCRERFTTFERIEKLYPAIIKKDGRREEFEREKIMRGLSKAFEKRPVSEEEKEALVDRVVNGICDAGEKELSSATVGRMIMDELRGMDEVAYVRFASVYRSFRDVNEFMEELTKILKERK